ncbi:chorismate--pyruvate lyase family protein [Streptomyces sp. NPDC056987]|uniref:chorismate--pyruvate lyase family protein n=1 Tax=Streptomyces sp. NPDC056987 TaxID=3345988 RepID=UPI00363D5446
MIPERGGLDSVRRLMLTTDGTVTPMLEHLVGERLLVARLVQSYGTADNRTRTVLATSGDGEFLFRSSELVGADSGTTYVRATSVGVPHALPPAVRTGLLRTQEPIGRLLRRNRTETFREILDVDLRTGSGSAEACRRYRIFVGGAPALLITETFLWDQLRDALA